MATGGIILAIDSIDTVKTNVNREKPFKRTINQEL